MFFLSTITVVIRKTALLDIPSRTCANNNGGMDAALCQQRRPMSRTDIDRHAALDQVHMRDDDVVGGRSDASLIC